MHAVAFLLVALLAPPINGMPHFWTSSMRHGLKPGQKTLDYVPGCFDVPNDAYGPHRGWPEPDGTGVWAEPLNVFSIYINGSLSKRMCAGQKHLIRLTFLDDATSGRQALLTSSQGTFDYWGKYNNCPNRVPFDAMANEFFDTFADAWVDNSGSFFNATLTLPCNVTGSVLLQSTSSQKVADFDGFLDYLRTANLTVPVDPSCSLACPPAAEQPAALAANTTSTTPSRPSNTASVVANPLAGLAWAMVGALALILYLQ